MDNLRNLIVRLDAGEKYGMGHLSRCISLTDEFIPDFQINFVIKTDNELRVTEFIENKFKPESYKMFFLDDTVNADNELNTIITMVRTLKAFLIVDHYKADKNYQLKLRKNNINKKNFIIL